MQGVDLSFLSQSSFRPEISICDKDIERTQVAKKENQLEKQKMGGEEEHGKAAGRPYLRPV